MSSQAPSNNEKVIKQMNLEQKKIKTKHSKMNKINFLYLTSCW